LLTPRAPAFGVGLLGVGGGLAGEGLVEHLLGKDGAEGEEEVFDLGEAGAPGGPARAVELVDEVFGDAFEVRAYFFYLRGVLFGARHPWFLSAVRSKRGTRFPQPI
jgi:hypothetical protein